MKALIAHHDGLARRVFSLYCKQLNIRDCLEADQCDKAYQEIHEGNYDVLIIQIDWIFNSSPLFGWLNNNRISRDTKIIAVTTDYSLDHNEWCENEGVLYIMVPVAYSVFKVLILNQ